MFAFPTFCTFPYLRFNRAPPSECQKRFLFMLRMGKCEVQSGCELWKQRRSSTREWVPVYIVPFYFLPLDYKGAWARRHLGWDKGRPLHRLITPLPSAFVLC